MNEVTAAPQAGDVIYVDRLLYKHYGVYIGNGKVVHFAAKEGHETNADNAVVHQTTLANFLKDGELLIDTSIPHKYTRDEIVQRALSCIGNKDYNLVFHNCEHFASWCVSGKQRSKQVENVVRGVTTAAVVAIGIGIAAGAVTHTNDGTI